MKKTIQISVDKKILLKARAKALQKETVISHVIQDFLSLWVTGELPDPDKLLKLLGEGHHTSGDACRVWLNEQ